MFLKSVILRKKNMWHIFMISLVNNLVTKNWNISHNFIQDKVPCSSQNCSLQACFILRLKITKSSMTKTSLLSYCTTGQNPFRFFHYFFMQVPFLKNVFLKTYALSIKCVIMYFKNDIIRILVTTQ